MASNRELTVRFWLIGVCAVLPACGSMLPAAPKEVRIPVAVPCLTEIPARPVLMPDSALAKLDDFALVLQLRIDSVRARDHVGMLESVLAACIR